MSSFLNMTCDFLHKLLHEDLLEELLMDKREERQIDDLQCELEKTKVELTKAKYDLTHAQSEIRSKIQTVELLAKMTEQYKDIATEKTELMKKLQALIKDQDLENFHLHMEIKKLKKRLGEHEAENGGATVPGQLSAQELTKKLRMDLGLPEPEEVARKERELNLLSNLMSALQKAKMVPEMLNSESVEEEFEDALEGPLEEDEYVIC